MDRKKRKLSAQLKTEERMNAKERMSRDGRWTEKDFKSYFGFRLYIILEAETDTIANYSVTTASSHDSQIDLSIPGIVNHKDKDI
ncbi:MAG: hypothetical protein QXZ17_13130 [Nitrososphaerota archaeon]